MRIASYLMPFFALLAGAAGSYLRMLELWNVFDDKGLPLQSAGISIALLVLSVALLLVVIVFSILTKVKYTSPQGFENAYGTEPLAYPFVFFVIGLAWLVATVKQFFDMNGQGQLPFTEMIFLALSALSAISVALFAIEVYQDPRRRGKLVLSVIPTVFMCFWLIRLYRENAANPILLSYAYQCLAIMASTLAFFFTTGYVYDRPATGKTLFAYFASIYFCFVTLADDHILFVKLIFIIIMITNMIYSFMLIRNLQRKEG